MNTNNNSNDMHRLLRRQLDKAGIANLVSDNDLLSDFINLINRTYIENDDSKNLVEHTLKVFSGEMEEINNKLESIVFYDKLTNIPNRYFLEKELFTQYLFKAKNKSQVFALAFLDLDHFKQVNDSLGHKIGDQLLIEVSKRLAVSIGKENSVCRLGGDEFALLIIGENRGCIEEKLNTVNKALSGGIYIDDNYIGISCSIGYAVYGAEGTSLGTLMGKADLAMYNAKRLGKNQYLKYDHSMQERSERELAIIYEMPIALREGEFELYYQPSVSPHTSYLLGAEALIRWNHSKLGVISPADFISIAEESGFINDIGRWVIKSTCEFIRKLSSYCSSNKLVISVNLSVKQLQDDGLYEFIQSSMEKNGIMPGQLAVEITESSLVKNKSVIKVINKIRELGVLVYLDDFGTGYSSLAYIKSMPIDSIKIDKLFLDDIKNKQGRRLFKSILLLCQSIGKEVIIEGVEHKHQQEFIKKQGCAAYQGFLHSKPVSEENFFNEYACLN